MPDSRRSREKSLSPRSSKRSRGDDRHNPHDKHHGRQRSNDHPHHRDGDRRSPRRHRSRSSSPDRRRRGGSEGRHERKRSRDRPMKNGHSDRDRDRRSASKEKKDRRREEEAGKKPSSGAGQAPGSPAKVKKAKKKVDTVSLSFGDEIEEAERAGVGLRSVEEVTAQRLQEEGRRQAINITAAASAMPLLPSGSLARGKSQQVLDDEAEVSTSTKAAEDLMSLPRGAAAINRGPKNEMEDRHTIIASLHSGVTAFMTEEMPVAYYGVFDGHCGALAAEVAAAQLHQFLAKEVEVFEEGHRTGVTTHLTRHVTSIFKHAFRKTEEKVMEALKAETQRRQDGSAALAAVVAGNVLCVANAGDCRAVLGRAGEEGMEAVRLSVDHKPNLTEERERITKAGGVVEFHGCWRVSHANLNMRLAVSRSFGDPGFKGLQEGVPALVSYEPFVAVRELKRGTDLCLILASDGIWDVLTDQEAVLLVDSVIRGEGKGMMGPSDHRRGPRPWRPTETNVREAADLLVSTSLSRGTGDNVTALVVCWD